VRNYPSTAPLSPLDANLHCSWDSLYETEIANHTEDHTDEGTIWFDDSAAEDKVVEFLDGKIWEENLLGEGVKKRNCSFLDLGMGNGHFLFRLRESEEDGEFDEYGDGVREKDIWGGRMLGVDYSKKSVEFARRIAANKGFDETEKVGRKIEFEHWDIMTQHPTSSILNINERGNGWDVVHDKGTFDAISLSEEKDERGRRICEGYKERVVPLIKEGGILLITSCNWTEEELNSWFKGDELEVVERIQYRSFSFGGRKGQTISSVCYRKQGLR
jgi:SAM-dependent methyltransferase